MPAGAPISTSSVRRPAGCSSGARRRLRPRRDERRRESALAAPGAEVVDLGGERARRLIIDHLRVVMLIRAYRVRGHLLADLDPLGLAGNRQHPELDPAAYGFSEADLDREFFLDNVLGLEKATLAAHRRDPAADLQRQDRRRVHAHPAPGPEGLDPGAHGRLAQPASAERGGAARAAGAAGGGRRASSASSTSSSPAPSGSAWTAARAPCRRSRRSSARRPSSAWTRSSSACRIAAG